MGCRYGRVGFEVKLFENLVNANVALNIPPNNCTFNFLPWGRLEVIFLDYTFFSLIHLGLLHFYTYCIAFLRTSLSMLAVLCRKILQCV